MNKKETIKDMKQIIMGAIEDGAELFVASANEREAEIEAEALYNAGYCKEQDFAREILEEIGSILKRKIARLEKKVLDEEGFTWHNGALDNARATLESINNHIASLDWESKFRRDKENNEHT